MESSLIFSVFTVSPSGFTILYSRPIILFSFVMEGALRIFIIALGLILRLVLIGQSFWLDEGASLVIANHSIKEIVQIVGGDFHPPLFYILLHYWLRLGITQDWFLRLPNVFFSLLSIYFSYKLVQLVAPNVNLKYKEIKFSLAFIIAPAFTFNLS